MKLCTDKILECGSVFDITIHQQLLQLAQIKLDFQNKQDALIKTINDVSLQYKATLVNDDDQQDSLCQRIINASYNFIGMDLHQDFPADMTSRILFDKTFQTENIASNNKTIDKYYRNSGRCLYVSQWSTHYALAIAVDGSFIRYDLPCMRYDYKTICLGGIPIDSVAVQKERNQFQLQQLKAKEEIFNFTRKTDKWGNNTGDAILRPELTLKYCEWEWGYFIKLLKVINQDTIGLNIFNNFRQKFAETVLFEDIKQTLQSMLQIHNVQRIAAQFKSSEFDLEVLRTRPHIQCMERIIRMHAMMFQVQSHLQRQILQQRLIQQQAILTSLESACDTLATAMASVLSM